MKKQVLVNKVCIRILSAPDLNQFFGTGSGSCKKVRILSNPDPASDPQHWFCGFIFDWIQI